MSKTSRTVHANIQDRTLLLLYTLDEKRFPDQDEPKPMSSVVSEYLNMFVDKLVSANKLEDVDPELATDLLNDWLGKEVLEDGIDDIFTDTELFGDDIDEEELEKGAASMVRPIEPDVKNRPTDGQILEPEPVLSDTPPWEESDIKSFEYFVNSSPLDRYIELANAPESPSTLKRAVQIVYSHLPTELWGSEKAEEEITDILPIIKQYEDREEAEKENEA